MSDQFVAEIRVFPFNYAPKGWALCNGQLMRISQNAALFSLLGTTYGGDGTQTFALPNLQGSAPMQQGQGQGLSSWALGAASGVENVTLLQSEMPTHNHTINTMSDPGTTQAPSPSVVLARSANANAYQNDGSAKFAQMSLDMLASVGGGIPHSNLQAVRDAQLLHCTRGRVPDTALSMMLLRPVRTDDDDFLLALFASVRGPELDQLPWTDQQKAMFVRQQLDAQTAHWRAHYQDTSFDIIERDGNAIGRFYVARWRTEIRIVEIALMPEHRDAGVGTALIRELLKDADRTATRVTLHVDIFNRARRLYERLGFVANEENGVQVLMERAPVR